jgi:hypothetical protein
MAVPAVPDIYALEHSTGNIGGWNGAQQIGNEDYQNA